MHLAAGENYSEYLCIHSALLIPPAAFKFGCSNKIAHTDPSVKNVVFTVQITAAIGMYGGSRPWHGRCPKARRFSPLPVGCRESCNTDGILLQSLLALLSAMVEGTDELVSSLGSKFLPLT